MWNKMRRGLTRELDTRIMNFREELLNKVLSEGWEQFSAALERGEKPVLESHYQDWVTQAMADNIELPLEVDEAR